MTKYPQVKITLTGTNGNAFAVLGRVLRAMKEAGISSQERAAFTQEATSADYEHLLATCMEWVEVS